MARKGRERLRTLAQRVGRDHPHVDAIAAIANRRVRVGGRIATNPRSLIRDDVPVSVGSAEIELRGSAKLEAALAAFRIDVRGRVALDLGASTGGFTRVLRRKGAARVYAVDAGFGQLLGSLRQDPAIVNLERTNLGELSTVLIPDDVGVVTVDLSYVGLASALPQLSGRVAIEARADLIALVKPMFELRLAEDPRDERSLSAACQRAAAGAASAGWDVGGIIRSPIAGRNGAIEFLLHGKWSQ